MQGHHVGSLQQFVQTADGARVAQRELGLDVVEDHPHAHAFGQHTDLGADVTVTDDAQHLVARLVAAAGRLDPATPMAGGVLLRNAAQQHDRLGDHQLGHAARVGIGRIEHRHAEFPRRVQIHLIGTDAEAAHRQQPLGMGQHVIRQLRARTDADDVRIGDPLLELVLGQ